RRKIQRIVRDRFQIDLKMPAIKLAKTRRLALLSSEKLHDAHASDSLLQIRVDTSQPSAHLSIRIAHARAEDMRRPVDKRDDTERRERTTPIDGQLEHDE